MQRIDVIRIEKKKIEMKIMKKIIRVTQREE